MWSGPAGLASGSFRHLVRASRRRPPRRCQSTLTLFTRKPSLSTPSSMSPVQVSYPRAPPPPAPRKPLPPSDAPWRASRAGASGPRAGSLGGSGLLRGLLHVRCPVRPAYPPRAPRGHRPRKKSPGRVSRVVSHPRARRKQRQGSVGWNWAGRARESPV